MADTEEAGAQPTTLATLRQKVKKEVTSIRWEMGMLVFVMVYFAVVIATFAIEDKQVSAGRPRASARACLGASPCVLAACPPQIARLICGGDGWITPDCKSSTLTTLDDIFYALDVVFLALFLLEISIKLFALGADARPRVGGVRNPQDERARGPWPRPRSLVTRAAPECLGAQASNT